MRTVASYHCTMPGCSNTAKSGLYHCTPCNNKVMEAYWERERYQQALLTLDEGAAMVTPRFQHSAPNYRLIAAIVAIMIVVMLFG